MRLITTMVLLVAFWVFALAPAAEPPATPAGAPSVEQLIEQLTSKDFKVRDAAGKALEARGVAVLPALRKARDHQDPEVRRRLDEIIPGLEAIATLSPRRVTLDLKERPLKDAVEEVKKQTGYKISFPDGQVNPRGENQLYTFQMKDATFWEALAKICETAGLQVQPGYGEEPFRLFYQEQRTPFSYHTGPFRVVAGGFHYSRSINFGQVNRTRTGAISDTNESLYFTFNILTEPKLPILGLGEVKLTEARDELGNSMVLVQNRGDEFGLGGQRYYRGGGGYRQFQYNAQAYLSWPVKAARKVRILKGTAPVTVLAEQRVALTIDKITTQKGKKFKAGSIEIDIEDVKTPAGAGTKQYDLKMLVRDTSRDNVNGDYSWMESLNQRIELRDAKGNKYVSRGNNWDNTSPSTVHGTWMFGESGNGQLGEAVQLVFYNWVTMEHELKFEFRDLPLP